MPTRRRKPGTYSAEPLPDAGADIFNQPTFMNTQNTETTLGAEQNDAALPRWSLSYAFDVSHYADFTIAAATEDDAEEIARALIKGGKLGEIMDGHAHIFWDGNKTNERVFSTGAAMSEENLEEYAEENQVELPPGWDTPPTPERAPEPFDLHELCNNIAAAPDIETETDAFRTLAAFAWEHMTEEGRAAMLARQDVKDLIARSESWAMQASGELDEDDDEPVTLGDVPRLPPAGSC